MVSARLAALFTAAAVTACGGGGGDPGTCNASEQLCNPPPPNVTPVQPSPPSPSPPPPPSPPAPEPAPGTPKALHGAEGFWTGTTNTGRIAYVYVQENGVIWMMYTGVGNPYTLAGAGYGNVSSNQSTFVGDGVDVNLEGLGVTRAQFTGTYEAGQRMSGAVQYTNSRLTFSATFDQSYYGKPDVSALAGTYTSSVIAGNTVETVTVTIQADGAVAGVSMPSGCTFIGTIAPRITGNVFATKTTFGGPPCLGGRSTFDGVAIYNAPAGQLVGAALNQGKTAGFFLLGNKQ